MKGPFRTALIAAVVSAVVAAGAAVATTQAFTLGTKNRVDAPSQVTNLQANGSTVNPVDAPLLTLENQSTTANATPLSLVAAGKRPPLKVNSGVKVAKLNADLLDGFDSAAFLTTATGPRFPTIGANPDPSFSVHGHVIGTVGPVQLVGACVDTGTDQMVTIWAYSSVGPFALVALSQSDVSLPYNGVTDAYANAAWTLGRFDAAHGTSVFRTLVGTILRADNHAISFTLFMGQNIRGATDGKCFFGGSAVVN